MTASPISVPNLAPFASNISLSPREVGDTPERLPVVCCSRQAASYGATGNPGILLDNQAAKVRQTKRQKLVWMPGTLRADGSVENVIQGRVERKGPKQGHWSKRPKQTNRARQYKRFWIEGQHNHKMQRDPKHPSEAIIGSRLQNTNAKMMPLKNADGSYISHLEDGAVILSYGMLKPAYVTTEDDIFDEARKASVEAMKTLCSATMEAFKQNAPPEKQGVNCGGSKSGGSESVEGSKK